MPRSVQDGGGKEENEGKRKEENFSQLKIIGNRWDTYVPRFELGMH